MKLAAKSTAPKHLHPATRRWHDSVTADYSLENHHRLLLDLACTALDRAEDARVAIAKLGTTFTDRFGSPHARPEVAVERDARLAFARLVRELDLSDEGPSAGSRPPALRSNRRI